MRVRIKNGVSSHRRAFAALAVAMTVLVLPLPRLHAAVPDYKLGDVATEDVVTPVAFVVVNPEATEALRQKVAAQVPFIVRQTTPSAAEAEAELRTTVANTKKNFLAALQRALGGRVPAEADLSSSAFAATLRDVVRDAAKDLPLDKLAPLWVRGASDETLVESLAQPVRSVMAQPIIEAKTDSTFPANQAVKLVPVKTSTETPSVQELENTGQTISSGKVISLWRARRIVETHFPSGQDGLGRFASAFVRTNAYADPALTEILRARRMEGVTVNDSYDAAQVVVKKGQSVDRKALSALAVVREKSLIGTLQTKLEQEKSVAGQISQQTTWIAAGLGGLGLVLLLVLWRLRARPAGNLLPAVVGAGDFSALPGGSTDEAWRNRALLAEGKAERAHEAIRTGVLGWMREKIFQTLSRQRTDLLSVQQRAQVEMSELEQRLEQLHTPLQERISAYEKRISELENDLAAKGEENRELLGARIFVAKQRLERERGRFGSN